MNWVRAAATSQLGEDEALGVFVEGIKIALYRSGGEVFATDDVCTHAYALLSDGGDVFMKMEKTPFANRFAMLRDRFGTSWMLLHQPQSENG